MDTKKLRKAATAVYLATEESVANDLSNLLNDAAHEIDRLRNELSVAERKVEEFDNCGHEDREWFKKGKPCPKCG